MSGIYKGALGLYVGWMVGMAAADVGKMPNSSPTPFSWWLPFLIAGVVFTPAVLGYLAGREDGKERL